MTYNKIGIDLIFIAALIVLHNRNKTLIRIKFMKLTSVNSGIRIKQKSTRKNKIKQINKLDKAV